MQENSIQLTRQDEFHIQTALKNIPGLSGGTVSLEGEPLISGEVWNDNHKLAYQVIMPLVQELLAERGIATRQDILINNRRNPEADPFQGTEHFLPQAVLGMTNEAARFYWESEIQREAEAVIRQLPSSRLVKIDDVLYFRPHRGPLIALRDDDGYIRGPVIDAIFQDRKFLENNTRAAVIIHDNSLTAQQRSMRGILLGMRGQLPPILNIFMKGDHLGRVSFTNPRGRTRNVQRAPYRDEISS